MASAPSSTGAGASLAGLVGGALGGERLRVDMKRNISATGTLVSMHSATGNVELENVSVTDYSVWPPLVYSLDRLFVLGRSIFLVHLPHAFNLPNVVRSRAIDRQRAKLTNARKPRQAKDTRVDKAHQYITVNLPQQEET